MEQIIIALYVNVVHLPQTKKIELLAEYRNMLINEVGITYHVFGTVSGETKMELIYPSSTCVNLEDAINKVKELELEINK